MIMFGRILRFVERNQLANWLFEMITFSKYHSKVSCTHVSSNIFALSMNKGRISSTLALSRQVGIHCMNSVQVAGCNLRSARRDAKIDALRFRELVDSNVEFSPWHSEL